MEKRVFAIEVINHLAKWYVKSRGRELLSMAIDQIGYAEKMKATVAAPLTANRRCRTSL